MDYLGRLDTVDPPIKSEYVIDGFRVSDGEADNSHALIVYVDGIMLDPRDSQKVWNHSPDGFNAGYSGSGPAQLALSILLYALHDEQLAVRLHQKFKQQFLAGPEYLHGDFSFVVDIEQWARKVLE